VRFHSHCTDGVRRGTDDLWQDKGQKAISTGTAVGGKQECRVNRAGGTHGGEHLDGF